MSNISIIGDGGWGTALALTLSGNGHKVTIWGPDASYLEEVKKSGDNSRFLPGVPLRDDLSWTASEADAINNADGIVLAVPSRFYSQTLERFTPHLPSDVHVVSVSKGFDQKSHHRLSVLAADTWNIKHVAALSGPSHAEEAARGVPTAVAVASDDPDAASFWQHTFNGARFRVYTSDDIIGVEVGGALKNVIAIAAGISDGLGFGDNTKAALMTRGLAEITRLGLKMGAKPETFSGLSGIGDLMVTCASRHSRNRGVGERIGKGENIDSILGGMQQVAEGVWTAKAAMLISEDIDIDLPITSEVNDVIYHGKNPLEAVEALMNRPPTSE